jgi:UDP-N-acetylmuramyl pentapeptide phosphotransferase/UDP-N-acetylglucosamine-1-phosphate transferase
MGNDQIEFSFLSIFALVTFFIFLLISKFSLKFKKGILLDQDFSKPQAFHQSATSRSGGIAGVISLNVFFIFYYLIYSKVLLEYLFICNLMFLIGFLDDVRTNISPFKRLFLMIIFLFASVHFIPIKISNIDIPYLSILMDNNFFSSIFILMCFLFIVNGANLIDGFNGLLAINLIIINSILAYINLRSGNMEFSVFITGQIIILLSFLLFNFPNSKIFFGDSGSYLMGGLVALNIIITNNLNSNYSSFFFCILLFYLFFEVFFSFVRKIIQNKSPVHPDGEHLHMLVFKKVSSVYGKQKGNYINSIFINLIYLLCIIPAFYFAKDPIVSKYWFFSLIIIYLLIYYRLYRLTKN